MALSQEERKKRLLNITTNKGYHDLYEEVFGEEVPAMYIRDGNVVIELIINAIYDNQKLKFNVPSDVKIWKNSINLI